jgi:hypothetical protein
VALISTADRYLAPWLVLSPSPSNPQLQPRGVTGDTAATGAFALAWNAFTASWTWSALAGGGGLLFAAFSIPFWVAGAFQTFRAVSLVDVVHGIR